jgi:F-type H+-transporting ATPase subunit delta
MQLNLTAARPYAQAVFELAREEGEFGPWSGMLSLLNTVVSDPNMKVLLANPTLKAAFLADFILDVCGDHLTEDGRSFVRVLAGAGRLLLVPQISALYEQQRIEAEGVVEVELISAYPLEETERQGITDAMTKRLGKKITITANINKDLIGGVVIRAGDSVIDASVSGRLRQLGNLLAE